MSELRADGALFPKIAGYANAGGDAAIAPFRFHRSPDGNLTNKDAAPRLVLV